MTKKQDKIYLTILLCYFILMALGIIFEPAFIFLAIIVFIIGGCYYFYVNNIDRLKANFKKFVKRHEVHIILTLVCIQILVMSIGWVLVNVWIVLGGLLLIIPFGYIATRL